MRKLTIVNQQYPPEVVSTGQIFHAMAVYMQAHGFDVTVVTGTPYYPGMEERPPRRETMGGVRVRRLRNTTFDKRSFRGKLLNLLTFEISLLFHCIFSISHDQTVLVTTAPPMAVVCTAIGRFFRRYRVVMTVQDLYPDMLAASGMSDPSKRTYRFLQGLMRRSMHGCDALIAISTDMLRHLQSAYNLSDVAMIPNLFPEKIRVIKPETAKTEKGWGDKLVVQYSGNFGIAHEYQTLLDTVRMLRADTGILFQIAGAGHNYDRLKQASEAEGLQNIRFEGYAPADRLERHLGTADISVVIFDEAFRSILMPSKYYGILASGRGVLLISGSENDISRDIGRYDIGVSFRHGEADRLAETLRGLRLHPDKMAGMGRRARALYDEQYTQETILRAYEIRLKEA